MLVRQLTFLMPIAEELLKPGEKLLVEQTVCGHC